MIGWFIALIVVCALAVGGGIGWSKISKEHREARNLPLDGVDFGRLKDGTYHGTYAGGMYRWRTNECDVTVKDGKLSAIELSLSKEASGENTSHEQLFQRVIAAQSLQVDTISGATLTSKAYLKGVENALIQAQME